jgi:hypothetical protein
MFKKIKLLKKLLALSNELKKIAKENDKTIQEFKHFLETAKVLYPKLGGLLEDIVGIAKDDSNKKV